MRSVHRPFTDDPRKPPGIPSGTVANICSRGSPMKPWSIDEIARIGRTGTRVTYAEPQGRANIDLLRDAFIKTGRATLEVEGSYQPGGTAIVFVLK
jgi:hypothetical protein